MPLVIDSMTTSIQVQDDAKLRKLVQEEVKLLLAEDRKRGGHGGSAADPDPADPDAGGSGCCGG